MSDGKGIRVTVEDLETGDKETAEVMNDYILICAGSCYVSSMNEFPKRGTVQFTIKGRKPTEVEA